jgi:acetyl-CoA/propionyl-CoA carboxylase, biotin carboxylase, biotin carboxyl carrier protein
VPQAYDSLIAKLIVTGSSRAQALSRARRALAEFVVTGMPTVLPFHRAVVVDPAFVSDFMVHTRWIETDFAGVPPTDVESAPPPDLDGEPERLTVEVGGKRLEVVVHSSAQRRAPSRPARRSAPGARGPVAGGDALVSPMQGTIVKLVAADGDQVSAGDPVVILEAMKMEQPLAAHKDGTVTGLAVSPGQSVSTGELIARIES